MSRLNRPPTAFKALSERRKGLPRERPLALSAGPVAVVRDRLDAFAEAFLADERPGLLFEFGRLIAANDAARRLFGSTATSDSFLEALKVSVFNSLLDEGLVLRTDSRIYRPALHQAHGRSNHATVACFLLQTSEATASTASLSERESAIVTLLVKGLTNRQIADELGTSVESVRKHISRVLRKTGTKNRTGLVGRFLAR